MTAVVKILMRPQTARFDADDERWLAHIADLKASLRSETEALSTVRTGQPNTKGAVTELVLALGSAGVFTTVVEVLRAWLARDKTRTLELSFDAGDGRIQHLSVSAGNASDQTLAPIAAAIGARLQAGS